MTETLVSFDTYTRLYKEKWKELMNSHDERNAPLRNYANGSVATTWSISFVAIKEKSKEVANLLLLWAHLDNGSLWYGLLNPTVTGRGKYRNSIDMSNQLKSAEEQKLLWIGEIAEQEIEFIKAMKLLRNYSLVETTEDQTGWVMHSVVHQWALSIQDDYQRATLSVVAIVSVGYAVPWDWQENGFWKTVPRYHAHVEKCRAVIGEQWKMLWEDRNPDWKHDHAESFLWSIRCLARFYYATTKLNEGEVMWKQMLEALETELGSDHELIVRIKFDLGCIYVDVGAFDKAEHCLSQVLHERTKRFGHEHEDKLEVSRSLGKLYIRMDRHEEAETMLRQALSEFEKTPGPDDFQTLQVCRDHGNLYLNLERLDEAEKMYNRAFVGFTELYGPDHNDTLCSCSNLGETYRRSGKLDLAEEYIGRAAQGFEKALGPEHIFLDYYAVRNMWDMGALRRDQGRLEEAREWFQKAHYGYSNMYGEDHSDAQDLRWRLDRLGKAEFRTVFRGRSLTGLR